jgi:hypothetical protein
MNKMATRASNVSKHPGIVDGGGAKRKRRTKAELEAEKMKKIAKKGDIEKKKKETISRIAVLEAQMEEEDDDAESHLKEGQRRQHSRKVHSDGDTSDALDPKSQPTIDEKTSSEDTLDEDSPWPKLKKGKASVRQEIGLINAKAGAKREQSTGKVSDLTYLTSTRTR